MCKALNVLKFLFCSEKKERERKRGTKEGRERGRRERKKEGGREGGKLEEEEIEVRCYIKFCLGALLL